MNNLIHAHVEPNEFLSSDEIKQLSPKESIAVFLGQMENKQPGSVDKLMKQHKDRLSFSNGHIVTYTHDNGGFLKIQHEDELRQPKQTLKPYKTFESLVQHLQRALEEETDLLKGEVTEPDKLSGIILRILSKIFD